MEKTHWKKVFNSDYLGSCDLEGDLKAVIKNVVVQKVKNNDGKEHERNVAHFTDSKIKPMVLNATNCRILKKFTKSPYINEWKNVAVQIYVKDDVKAFGELTEGLRFREVQPTVNKKTVLKKDMPAWGKAVEYLKKGGSLEEILKKYDVPELETLKTEAQ